MPATPAEAPSGTAGSAWESGRLVGRYFLLAPIAQGGMAEIWLARQSGVKGFEKLVVIKRMTDSLELDPEHVEMFLTEARLAAQLNHQHVVQIFELGEEAHSFFIAMEYLDGENLSVVRRAGKERGLPMSDAIAARLISWAAEGLHYAHTKVGLDGSPLNIVHRDVSPQNLIVTYDGGLKVVDFGIAKVASQKTMSGKLKGKLAYMSPEQARAQTADARSDVFALGIVFFELVTGGRLLPKMQDLELLAYMAGMDPLPRASERRPDIPRPLENIITKALARKREERFQTARDFQAALEDWLRTSGQSNSSSDVSDYMHMLFADRIRERRKLIEAAMSSDLTPSAARTIQGLAKVDAGSSSLNSNRSAIVAASQTSATSWLPLAVLGVVGAAVVAGIVAISSWRPDPTPVVTPPPPVVVAAPPVLVVDSEPSGAEVQVDGEPKGKAPVTVTSSLGEHKVTATLGGYERTTRVVKLEREGQQVRVVMALPPTPRPSDPTPKNPVARAQGKLTLKTDPWTSVYLGRNKLGDTPLINIPLPAGRHTLRLSNPEAKLDSSIEVEIKPGETTVKKLHL